MMTGRGFSYALLTVLVYLILAYSGFSLLFVLFFVLLLLPPLSALQLLWAGRRLSIAQVLDPGDVERGEPARLTVSLRQHGWLSHGELDLVIGKPGLRGQIIYERHTLPLLAGVPAELAVEVDCRHRGHYPVGISSIRARDVLGLFYLPLRSRAVCRRQMPTCCILPHPEVIPGTEDLASLLADWQHRQTQNYGDEIDAVANLRAHRPGDSLKRTHWKVSARLNEIMIKEFENPIQREGLLVLDLERPTGSSGNRAGLTLGDFYMDRAAYLIQMALATGNHLRVVAYQADGRHEHLTTATGDLRAMQYALTDLDWADGWPADLVLQEETAHNQPAWFVILLACHLSEAAARQLQDLQNRGVLTSLILVGDASGDAAEDAALAVLAAQRIPCIRISPAGGQSDVP